MKSITIGCAVVGGVAGTAYYADYRYQKFLYSSAVECMNKHRLAIVTSGCRESYSHLNYNFSVVKLADEYTKVVGVVRLIGNHYFNDWTVEVLGEKELVPIGKYISYSILPLEDKILHFLGLPFKNPPLTIIQQSIEKLPRMEPTEKEKQDGNYSTRLYHDWVDSGSVIKRQ
jgi:hypothetical protein